MHYVINRNELFHFFYRVYSRIDCCCGCWYSDVRGTGGCCCDIYGSIGYGSKKFLNVKRIRIRNE